MTLLVARLGCAGARRFEHRVAFPESNAMRATARSFGAHPLCRGGSQKLPSGSSASFILAFGRAWAKPRASRASGKQRLKSERCVRSCRWDARSRLMCVEGAALPVRGHKHLLAAGVRGSSVHVSLALDGDGARRAEWARRLERVPLPASNVALCSYRKHQSAPALPSRLAVACFLAHFGLRGCKAGFSVQARWMLRMRGRGAGAAAPCTRKHVCLGSGNAAPQHQIWMRRRQEAFAGLARLAPCEGGAALFDGARSEAGLAGARRSAPRRVSGTRCDACKLLEASDCIRAAEWALRSLLAASPEFHRTPAAGLGKRAESFVAEREAAAKFGALRPKLSM